MYTFLLLVGCLVSWPAQALAMQALWVPGASVTVPQGAQRFVVGVLEVTADCGADLALEEVIVRHRGLGDRTELTSVSLFTDGVRRTQARGLDRRADTAVRFLRGVSVPACETRSFELQVSLSATAMGEHELQVVRVATAAGDLQVVGQAGEAVSVTPHATPVQVSFVSRPITTSLAYGSQRTVARFVLRNDGRRAVEVTALVLTNDGAARDADLQQLQLRTAGGEELSAVLSSLTGDVARFSLMSPLRLEAGAERLLIVRADVRGRRKRTIDFVLADPADVVGREAR
jgi:hypothetical protein